MIKTFNEVKEIAPIKEQVIIFENVPLNHLFSRFDEHGFNCYFRKTSLFEAIDINGDINVFYPEERVRYSKIDR